MRPKNKESFPFWRLYCNGAVKSVNSERKLHNIIRINATSTKAWDWCLLSTCLYPWPGTGVLKVCFGDLLWVCKIKAIFPQACNQVFLRLPHNVWHHSTDTNMRIHLSPSKPDTKEIFKKCKTMPIFLTFLLWKIFFFPIKYVTVMFIPAIFKWINKYV